MLIEMGRGGAVGKLASSDALDGSLARRHQDGPLDQVSMFSLPHLSPPPWLDAALLLDGCMGSVGCAGDSNPSPASRAHSQCSDRGVPGLLSVWFELVAGLHEPGLISCFIAQAGACKMVTFYCFLAFSFFLVSVTFSPFPYCFKFLPHATNFKGCHSPAGTHSSHLWCSCPSLLSSSPPCATSHGPMDPSSRAGLAGKRGCVFPRSPT